MATVGSLIVDLVANTASFISGMKSSQQMVVDFKRTAGGGFTLNIDASKATDTLSNLHSLLDGFAGNSGPLRDATDQIGEYADAMNKARDATSSLQDLADKFGPLASMVTKIAREMQAFVAALIIAETKRIEHAGKVAGEAPDTEFNREAKRFDEQNQRDWARIEVGNKSVSAFNDAITKGPAAFMQQLNERRRFAGLNEREQVWQQMIESFKDVPGATDTYKKMMADAALKTYDEAEARKASRKAIEDETAARKQIQDTLNATRAKAAIDLLFGGIPGVDLAGLGDVRRSAAPGGVNRAPAALQFGTNAAFVAEGNANNAIQQAQLDAQKKIVTNTQQAADQLAKFQGAAVYRIT